MPENEHDARGSVRQQLAGQPDHRPRQPANGGSMHLVTTSSQERMSRSPLRTGKHPVVIFGAHPDDAALGAGGLVAHMTGQRIPVLLVTATSGALGGDPAVRKAEDLDSARILGAELMVGKLRDGHLSLDGAIHLVKQVINAVNPGVVFVHHEHDTHQDHRNLSLAVASVARHVPNLLHYEGPTSQGFSPSVSVDISAVWQQKWDSLVAHASQMSRTNLLAWTDSISMFRAWPRYSGSRCEAFHLAYGDLFSLSRVFSASQFEPQFSMGLPARMCETRMMRSDRAMPK